MESLTANLEYYKVFYYAAKCGSATQAAQLLNISQPAVSQSLRQLEEALGTPLFSRTPKGIRLNAEGELLFSYVSAGYEQILLGEKKLSQLLQLEIGEVHIGASDMTLQFFLLPYLEKFHQLYPSIRVFVTNAPTPETLQSLRAGKIDFGVISSPYREDAAFTSFPVQSISDVFVAGSAYEHLKGRILPLQALEQLPVITLEHNTSTRSYIDTFFRRHNVCLKPEFELATSDMVVQFARRNLGIGNVVRDFAKPYLDSGELFELSLDTPIPPRNICVIYDKKSLLPTAAGKLLQMIQEALPYLSIAIS